MPRPFSLKTAVTGAVGVVALALVLTGCSAASSASSSAAAQPVSGGDLTIARLGQNVTSLDPDAKVLTSANAYTLDKIFDTLVTQNDDGSIEPSLATSYTTSDDGLTWTFTLRDGVTFSDGTPLTSKDVVYSIKRHLKVGGALPLSAPISSVKATSDTEVTITLKSAYTPLLTELATFASSIVPNDLEGKTEEAFFADPVGSGPFVLGTWDKSGNSITLNRNEKYWQDGKPYVDSVTFITASDDNSLVQQLQGGQVDAIQDVPIANVAALKADSSYTVSSVGSWNQDEIFFNTAKGTFANQTLRQAVVQAIDRASLTEATTFGTGTVGTTYVPATVRYSDQTLGIFPYNLDAAKAAFAQSGVASGTTVTLLVESGSQSRDQQAQVIQKSLEALGLTVEIKKQDSSNFWTNFPAGDYEFALTTVVADTSDPDNISTWQVDSTAYSKSFFTGYKNSTVDSLVAKGRTTADGTARQEIYSEIQKLVSTDVPSISLDYTSNIIATQSDVHGIVVSPNGTLRLQDAWIG